MDIVLVAGLWLTGETWSEVAHELTEAGHTVHPVTLPGMEARDADRSAVTLDDCVAAVVAAIDESDGPVVLVGHSGGCGVATVALDRRVPRVARMILIGGFPAIDGQPIMSGFVTADGGIPLPDWSEFDDADLRELDEAMLARFRERAIPSPAALATEPVTLRDDHRYDVPLTAVAPEYTTTDLKNWIEGGAPPVQEFTRFTDVTYVDLPTGHWPQFSRPVELADVILSQPPLAEPSAEDSGFPV